MKQNVINNDELVIRKALNLTGRQVRQKSLGIQITQIFILQLYIPPEEPITSPMKKTDGTQIQSTEKNERGLILPILSLRIHLTD